MRTKLTVGLAVLALAATSAWAGTITMGWGSPHQSGFHGGQFTVTVKNISGNRIQAPDSTWDDWGAGDTFQTFCVETNEYFSIGGTYFAEVSVSAKGGGTGGQVSGVDPLSYETAYLYTSFMESTIPFGYYDNASTWDALDSQRLQEAIWHFEGETGYSSVSNNFVTLAENAVSPSTGSPTWTDGIGRVRVLRLWRNWSSSCGYSGNAQDQLVWFDKSTSTQEIPLPASAWLGLGLLAVLGLGRRLRRRREETALS